MISLQDKLKSYLQKIFDKLKEQPPERKKLIYIFCGCIAVTIVIVSGIGIFGSGNKKGKSDGVTFQEENIVFTKNYENGISRGNVIIFDRDNAFKGYLIKRVIAVGGDTVNIDDEGKVYVNGEKYQTDKSYFRKDVQMPLTVPEGQLFVLGDNGDESADSRNSYVGLVDAGTVKGVAIQ